MYGSIDLQRGTLFVGGQDRRARLAAFDLDGRVLSPGFAFADARLGRSVAAGLAVDSEYRLWVADTTAHRVRCFTVFGQEVGGLGVPLDADLERLDPTVDVRGELRRPVDVLTREVDGVLFLVVASAGVRRHAVQIFDESGQQRFSLRSLGDPHATFGDVTALAAEGRSLYVAERRGRVQVFRDLDFQFAFDLPERAFEPQALASLEDGRLLVANGGVDAALLLLDAHGRLLSEVATGGEEAMGTVQIPGDVAVERDVDDTRRRVVLLDADGERIQIFTLAGRCYGAFSARA